MWLVTVIYWLQAFLAPVVFLGITGLFFGNKNLLFVLLGTGVIAGVIFAEYIRKRFGLDVFFARIFGPNSMDDKLKMKNNKQDTDAVK